MIGGRFVVWSNVCYVTRRPIEFADWPESLAPAFGPYRGIVRHHVDGDTFDVFVDCGFNEYRYMTVRLLGVDTPETNRAVSREDGLAAKQLVQRLMPVGARVLLHTRPDRDSFGRYLARVTLEDGTDLTDALLLAGYESR